MNHAHKHSGTIREAEGWLWQFGRWVVMGVVFFTMTRVASATITCCPTSRNILTFSNRSADLEDLTGELETSDPEAVALIEQSPEIGTSFWLGAHLVLFAVTHTNETIETSTALLAVLDTTPPQLVCGTNKTVECGSLWGFDEPAASIGCAGINVTLKMGHHSQPERETSSSLIWNAEELFCLGYLALSAKPGKTKNSTEP